MGSSAKRKKEKKQDFQKAKLKVGKTKAKPDNQTSTSFRAKAIVLNQQSLNVSAPSATQQFQHHVSMLSSRSDSQRKDSLSYLTTFIGAKPSGTPLPQPIGGLLDKMSPLVLDGNSEVRGQLLKLFQSFHKEDVQDHVLKVLPFLRAGMTHLSRDIRLSSIDLLSCLLDTTNEEVSSCAGGWIKTLESFVTLLGWKSSTEVNKWSSGKAALSSDTKLTARTMQVLAQFLRTGFVLHQQPDLMEKSAIAMFPLWYTATNSIPSKSNAYSYLNLFGTQQNEESQILDHRDDRIRIFNKRFLGSVLTGIETARQEGGELGRAAGALTKALKLAEGGE